MKPVVFISLIFAIYANVSGQIVNPNNSWNYLKVLIPTCEKSTNCEGKFYENYSYNIGDDTVINNKVYSKVIVTSIWDNDTTSNSSVAGFLREEENNKKVYSLLSDINDSAEVLIYDFTIKKDSTFNSTYTVTYHTPEGDKVITETFFSAEVLNIDSVINQGIKRLRITFSEYPLNLIGDLPVQDTTEWIEGIGSNKGLLNYPYGELNLLCFKQNKEIKYLNDNNYDCQYLGPKDYIIKQNIEKIKIYPNPLKGETLNIVSQTPVKSISIYSISGIKIVQYFPGDRKYQLQLNNLKHGVYIVNIDNYYSKLIVE